MNHSRRLTDRRAARGRRNGLWHIEHLEPRYCLSAVAFATHEIEASDAWGAWSVHAADLDGDGDADLLSASYYDDKIAWYENTDGAGSFGPQQVITTKAHAATSVHAADLDGDGDLDVISATDEGIAWYENTDGRGTFGPQQQVILGCCLAVYVADLDGDGDLDVLSASSDHRGGAKIAWYENTDGQGHFGQQLVIWADDRGFASVHAADVDGDGDVDVISTGGGLTAWYENTDGAGSFGSRRVISTEVNGADSVSAADLDGDGDHDLLFVVNDDRTFWYENINGEGSFGPEQVIAESIYASSVYAADLDGDGDLDVLSTSRGDRFSTVQGTDAVTWYENTDGRGRFGPQQVIVTDADADFHSVLAVDLDDDGDLDVASASLNGGIATYENTSGEGDFGPQRVLTAESHGARSVQAADLDGDGDLDVLLGTRMRYGNGKLAWRENTDGLGSFGPERVISTEIAFVVQGHRSVLAADVDNDGDHDVLVVTGNGTFWYENTDGLGSFGPEQVIANASASVRSIYLADLDGDGDLDLLSAAGGVNDGQIAWYENTDGTGGFGPKRVITEDVALPYQVSAADLDGDGDLDVLSASDRDDKVAWYENTDGQGHFGQQLVIWAEDRGARSVHAADLDGDGDLDVLSASTYNDKIAWYENTDGAGSFGSQQVISTEVRVDPQVSAADLDGDGDLDVLSASMADDKIAWYENTDGVATFGPQQVITTAAHQLHDVHIADLDGDGDLDVLAGSTAKVAWHENLLPHPGDANRDGRFDSADFVQVFQAGKYEDNIEDNSTWEEGDWNGDGDFDTADFVLAFQTGLYEVKSGLNAREIAAAVDWLFAQDDGLRRGKAFVA